jgi:hypothetical protein
MSSYGIKSFLVSYCALYSEVMVVVFLMFKTGSMVSHYVVATPLRLAR